MPASVPRLFDPDPVETRLAVVAEMLDRAVAELNRVMADIKELDPPAHQRRQSTTDSQEQER